MASIVDCLPAVAICPVKSDPVIQPRLACDRRDGGLTRYWVPQGETVALGVESAGRAPLLIGPAPEIRDAPARATRLTM